MNDIHDRLIARLKGVRTTEVIDVAFNIAIDNVRRRCPDCGDLGNNGFSVLDRHGIFQAVPCDCNRPALLVEWEQRLRCY